MLNTEEEKTNLIYKPIEEYKSFILYQVYMVKGTEEIPIYKECKQKQYADVKTRKDEYKKREVEQC